MKRPSLKDRAKLAVASAMKALKFVGQIAVEYIALVGIIAALVLMSLKLPEMHNHYLRAKVASRVYMIRDSYQSGGGTGFAIKAPSGQSYILTNDHVCGVSKDGESVLVTSDEGSMRRRIIAHDEDSDLCLIEGLPGVSGLSVADSAPGVGDTLNVIGHPRLMPKHLSKGEMTARLNVSIPIGIVAVQDPDTGDWKQVDPAHGGILPEKCSMRKNSQVEGDYGMFFFSIHAKVCFENINNAYQTAVIIYPGNSGSPVVNFWGNVEGVAFAADNSTNWGLMISLHDVKHFLRNY